MGALGAFAPYPVECIEPYWYRSTCCTPLEMHPELSKYRLNGRHSSRGTAIPIKMPDWDTLEAMLIPASYASIPIDALDDRVAAHVSEMLERNIAANPWPRQTEAGVHPRDLKVLIAYAQRWAQNLREAGINEEAAYFTDDVGEDLWNEDDTSQDW